MAPRTLGMIALLAVLAACSSRKDAQVASAPAYPETRRGDVAETHWGSTVADPYRWLENDPAQDGEVADWIAAQRRTTSAYLAGLPGRAAMRQSLAAAYDVERIGAPQKEAGRYFYTSKRGGQDQAALYVREGAQGAARTLVDPAVWSDDGSVALAEWRASGDGKRVAYAVQSGGSDWRTIRVIDVATGRQLDDEIQWARFTQVAWARDGSGFYYSRYPAPKPGREADTSLADHAVYFHRIGTPQQQDTRFYAMPRQPGRLNSLGMTADGRYAIIYSTADLVKADIAVVDLDSKERQPRTLVENAAHRWSVIGNAGATLYLLTDKDAARSKIVRIDLAAPEPVFVDVLAQQDGIMTGAAVAGDRLLVSYLVDATSALRRYTLAGVPDGAVRLPGIGSVSAVTGQAGDGEAFFVYASFNQPNTVMRYDVAANQAGAWIAPKIGADLGSIEVRQVFYTSRDGTRIPMFLARRRDVTGPAPTLLTGYGAFAISMPPAYSAMLTGWMLQGGVLAIPGIRGGGEYGAAWHAAGSGVNKQKGFDDFIAAAEYLHAEKIAAPGGIAAYGDSAGGLLVGAVVNQRPELFGAALPSVGVMDMLRYHRFSGGQLWIGEYGNPAVEADFKRLLAYSPYHQVGQQRAYPAILATTGEADNRVVPAHSYKYIARLQAADIGRKPRLIRIDQRAGHGAGKPTSQVIEEAADMWAFAAYWTGLEPQPQK